MLGANSSTKSLLMHLHFREFAGNLTKGVGLGFYLDLNPKQSTLPAEPLRRSSVNFRGSLHRSGCDKHIVAASIIFSVNNPCVDVLSWTPQAYSDDFGPYLQCIDKLNPIYSPASGLSFKFILCCSKKAGRGTGSRV